MIIPYPLKSGTHKVISGTLRRVEIFNKNQLRYYFDDQIVDTYITLISIQFYNLSNYKYKLTQVNAMTDIIVTLELIEKNGENYLIKVRYNEDVSESKTDPLTLTEKNDLKNRAGIRFGCVGFFMLIPGLMYGFTNGFGKESLPVLLIFAAPFLLTWLFYYIPERQKIKDSRNKIVITTIIREVITVLIPRSRSNSPAKQETMYRIGTGELIKYYSIPLHTQDKVRLYYTEEKGQTDGLFKLEKLS